MALHSPSRHEVIAPPPVQFGGLISQLRVSNKALQKRVSTDGYLRKPPPSFIILSESTFRMRWDLYIIALATYNCFMLPFIVAFWQSGINNPIVRGIEIIIYISFASDIILNFRTSYIDMNTSEEIMDPNRIAKDYIFTGTFIFDLLATIPFNYIAEQHSNSLALILFGVLKIVRIYRIGKILMYMKTVDTVKIMLRFLLLGSYMFMYNHIIACSWFLIVSSEESWIPPTDFIRLETNLYDADILEQYIYSYYHSLFMFCTIEIAPRMTEEYLFASIMNIIGALFAGFLFGQMAVLVANMNKRTDKFNQVLDSVSTTMSNMKLPENLQIKISDFLMNTYHIIAQQSEYDHFMKSLPPSLQHKVNKKLFKMIIKKNRLFKFLPPEFLITKMESRFYQPEANVVSQFEVGNDMFFISNGQCEVEVRDENKDPHRVRILNSAEIFGEVGLLYNTYRTATVRTITYTSLASINSTHFKDMISRYPAVRELLTEMVSRYKDPWKKFLIKTLSKLSFLKSLTPIEKDYLMYSLTQETKEAGSYIYQAGDSADKIHIISEGKVLAYFTFYDRDLYYFFRNKARNLSTPTNLVTFSDRGFAIGKKGSFEVDVSLDVIEKGSIIAHHLASVGQNLVVNYKVMEPTTVLSINQNVLERLQERNKVFKASFENFKSSLFKYDSFRKENIMRLIPLDHIKYFKSSLKFNRKIKRYWQIVKNEVLRIVIQKREARKHGVPNIKQLVKIIKASLEAERQGRFEMARKIASGEIPPEAVKGADLLSHSESINPLLTQFASKAAEMRQVFLTQINHVSDLSSKAKLIEQRSENLERKLNVISRRMNEFLSYLHENSLHL